METLGQHSRTYLQASHALHQYVKALKQAFQHSQIFQLQEHFFQMFVFLVGKKKNKKLYSTILIHLNPSSQSPRQNYLLLWTADINTTCKSTRLNLRDESTKQLSPFTLEKENRQLIWGYLNHPQQGPLLQPQREALMSTNKYILNKK